MPTSELHQEILSETINELNNQGYIAMDMTGARPDGIAFKDNKIYAIEVLLLKLPGKRNINDIQIVKEKKAQYSQYDEIIFKISHKKIRSFKLTTNGDIIDDEQYAILKKEMAKHTREYFKNYYNKHKAELQKYQRDKQREYYWKRKDNLNKGDSQ